MYWQSQNRKTRRKCRKNAESVILVLSDSAFVVLLKAFIDCFNFKFIFFVLFLLHLFNLPFFVAFVSYLLLSPR